MSIRYYVRTFDLANARDNQEVDVTGGLLHAISATSRAAVISVRFDGSQLDSVDLKKGDGVEVEFKRLFLTNAAQPGETIDLLVVADPKEFKLFQGAEIGDIDTIGTLGSITAPVDISDDAARLLGVVDSITDPVSVTGAVDVKVIEGSAQWDQVGNSAGLADNPGTNLLIATTGDRPAGLYQIFFGIASTIAQNGIMLRHRTAADASIISYAPMLVANFNPGELWVQLALNEDVVVIATESFTGSISAYLSWKRLTP